MGKDLIVMIGYRGSGKSTLAQILAQKIKWKYFSSDKIIEKEVGELSKWIPFNGWSSFREKEKQVCHKLSQKKQAVIDLGGGVVENPKNLEYFLNKAIVFWIDTNREILIKRLQKDKHRPLLSYSSIINQGPNREKAIIEETRKKYEERLPLYRKFSHHRIESCGKIETTVSDMLKILKKYHTIKYN